MDVLSEVLRVIHLSGVVYFRGEFTRPWSLISSSPDGLPAKIKPGAESITFFHILTSGSCYVSCSGSAPIQIEKGDVIVLARADQCVLESDPGLKPVPIKDVFSQPTSDQIAELNYGGGGEATRFICGYLHSDQRFGPLLDALPALLRVRVRDGTLSLESFSADARFLTSHTLDQKAHWWQAAIDNLVSEATTSGQGNRAVLARLSELLFMEIVRWQLTLASDGRTGWLAGLNDPQVGRALALLHGEPARAWTVEELAYEAASSRAALAKRFVELVGETPIQYLTGWRMHLARRMLLESALSLAEIAGRVGYDSEATFNRAFRRVVGTPPATWREGKIAAQQNQQPSGGSATAAGPVRSAHREPSTAPA
jgi:AraC-like DNA-binding protein